MSTDRGGARGAGRQRGFALLIVLWAIVLAALIGTQVTALGRRETRIAANLRSAAVTEAAADGAVNEAIFRLMRTEVGWDADGTPHALTIGQVNVNVVITDENGKVNINDASAGLLASLLGALGVDDTSAQSLGAAIVAWRGSGDDTTVATDAWRQRYQAAGFDYVPPFEAFQSIDELGLVLGMTPDLYAVLEPHLTIYSAGGVDPNKADAIVSAALRAAPATEPAGASSGSAQAVTIEAQATGPDGASFARHAVVRLGAGADGYSILVWDRGLALNRL